jgi:glutathione reductase (NADPH)
MAAMSDSFDLVVVGGGSGGVRAARVAAQLGAKVALVEEKWLGGTCVNVGCIPKKLLSYAAHAAHEMHEAAGFGWTLERAVHDWPTLISAKNVEVSRLNVIYRELLTKVGVEVIDGRALVGAPGRVEVEGRHLRADKVLLATGGRPRRGDFLGADLAFTSDEAFFLARMPRRLAIVGAGYIGLEFASIFSGLGAEVTVIGRDARVLPRFDGSLSSHVQREMEKYGTQFVMHDSVRRIERVGDAFRVVTAHARELVVDGVMLATGRVPRCDAFRPLDLAEDARGRVVVDGRMETSVPNVYAVGDLVGRAELTPVALGEGMALAKHLFGGAPPPDLDYPNVATAVFTLPPIGTVGLSEETARAQGHRLRIFQSEFRPLKHTVSGSKERTLVKLVVDEDSDRVLGIHMAGPDAPEIIQGFAVAVTCGVTKAQLDRTLGVHPTAAEELVTLRG